MVNGNTRKYPSGAPETPPTWQSVASSPGDRGRRSTKGRKNPTMELPKKLNKTVNQSKGTHTAKAYVMKKLKSTIQKVKNPTCETRLAQQQQRGERETPPQCTAQKRNGGWLEMPKTGLRYSMPVARVERFRFRWGRLGRQGGSPNSECWEKPKNIKT